MVNMVFFSAFIFEFDTLTYLSSASYPRISFSRTRGPSCDKSHFQKDPCAHGFSLKFEFKYKEAFEVCTVLCED